MSAPRIACILALLAALTGCGGSSDPAPSSNSTATPTATATSDPNADRGVARSSRLQLEDFPSGWTAAKSDSGESECPQVQAAKSATSARVDSPRFAESDTTQVENSVYIFPDQATAEKGFEQVSGEETTRCYAETLTEALSGQRGLEVGETESEQLSVEAVGDQRRAARLTVPLTAQGNEVDLVMDLVFVRAGRGLSLNLFTSAVSPFDGDLRDELIATSAGRLSDSLAAR